MPLVPRRLTRTELPNSFSTTYSNALAYMTPSSPTEALNLPPPLLVNSPASLNTTFASPLPTTPKLTDKPNEPIKRLKPISGSSALTTLGNGLDSSVQQNSSITPFPIARPKPPPFPFSSDTNQELTCHSERPSSLR